VSINVALYDLDFFGVFLPYLEQEKAHGQYDYGDIGEANQAVIVAEEVDIIVVAGWRRRAGHFLVRCLGIFGLFAEK
jgi:hypothetical protein